MIDLWEVRFSEQAIQDIRDIHDYIAYELLAPENAKKQIDRIIQKAESLDFSPMRNPLYENKKWKEKGLRRMVVDNFLIFYVATQNDKQVQIVSIVYGARNIDNILK